MRGVLLGLALAAAMGAGPPRGGPAELTVGQKRKLGELAQKMRQATAEDDFERAYEIISEAAALREKWLGRWDWETVDLRYQADSWARLRELPRARRPELGQASRILAEGGGAARRGDHRAALAKAREAHAMCSRLLGSGHPTTLNCLRNAGYGIHRLGDTAEGVRVLEVALSGYKKAVGEIHPETAATHALIAAILTKAGKGGEARAHLEKALDIRRKALGEAHPDTAAAYTDLGGYLGTAGDPVGSLAMHEDALASYLASRGPWHGAAASAYNKLAFALSALGREEQALPHFERGMAIYLKVSGEKNRNTAASSINLAGCLQRLGRPEQGLPFAEKALATCRTVLGEADPLTSICYHRLSAILNDLGEPGRALLLAEKALALTRARGGEDSAALAAGYAGVAYSLELLGEPARALPLYEQALSLTRVAVGEIHPNVALLHNNVAFCLVRVGQPAKALPQYEKSLAIQRAMFGESHPGQVRAHNNLAECWMEMGQPGRALPHAEKALRLSRDARGEHHRDTLLSYSHVSSCLSRLGRPRQALALDQKALAACREALGEGHYETASAYHNLAASLTADGQAHEAVRLLQGALPYLEAARYRKALSGFDRSLAFEGPSAHTFLSHSLASAGQPRNAFRHAEASLARALLDDVTRVAPEELAALKALDGRLAAIDRELVSLFVTARLSDEQLRRRGGLSRLRKALMGEQGRIAASISTRHLVALEEIQAALPADGALIFWVEWDQKGGSFVRPAGCVVRGGGPPAWAPAALVSERWSASDTFLPTQAHLALVAESLPDRERDALVAREPESFRTLARAAFEPGQADKLTAALRRQRIEPLLPHLKGVKRLFVVPTGRMAAFPVELLAPEYLVSYVPSGTFLHRTLKGHRPLSAESMLALGDPVFGGPEGSPPPEAGLFISAVVPGGAGAAAGFRVGDVLVRYEGKPVRGVEALEASGAGSARVWREGRTVSLRLPRTPWGIVFAKEPPRLAFARHRGELGPTLRRGTGHKPLPGTAHEVNAIAQLVKNTTRLVGSAASEQALDDLIVRKKLREVRILHLATHGVVNQQMPDGTCLIMAQDTLPDPLSRPTADKVYDGRLTVRTIRRTWELDADLVVLSACETALGKDKGGDGLLGFSHAFLSRGARTVVLSRWKVDDGATGLLMVRFYENLLGTRGEKLGRAAALQEAKGWLAKLPRPEAEKKVAHMAKGTLRRSEGELPPLAKDDPKPVLPKGDRPYASPYYWAAWALVGDPD